MIYIFDRNEVLLEIISEEDYSDFSFKDKLQTSSIFSFNTSRKNNIRKGNKVGFFRKEKFQLFLIDDFTELTYVDESKVSVVTISDYNILSNSIIEDKRVINGTLREAAEKALEGSEYKVGIVEDFESKNINFYFVSRLKALNDIINTFNCEIDVRIEIDDSTGKIINKYIDFKHRLGKDTGLRFTFDTNLEIIEKSPIGDHFNVLYGRGKSLETDSGGYSRKLDFAEVNNGKKYVEDLESIKKYGRLEGIYEDGNIEDKQLLLSKTLEKLEEIKNPKFTYKVSLKNLMAFDKFEHYQCEKGDTILIVDEEEDLVLEARIVEMAEEDDEVVLTLSNIQTGLMDEDLESEIGDIKDKIDIIENNKPTIDTIYPDTLPNVPILTAKALYASVILDWTYSNKDYYTYELFASQIKDFNPTPDNRIFEGKASSFLHEVNPSQTWYYRARAKNAYGNTTLFSTQVEVTTRKISDSAEIFEEAAIGHAIIKDLDMDKATVGKLKGQRIDARNLTVTDGNEKETLSIDSYGNVNLDVTKLSIKSKDVEKELKTKVSQMEFAAKADEIYARVSKETDANNVLPNGAFEDGLNGYEGWKAALSVDSGVLTINAHDTEVNYGFLTPRFSLEANNTYTLSFDANSYYNTLKLNYCYLMDTQYGNIRLDSNIQLDPAGGTTRVKVSFATSDKYRNVRLLIGYDGHIDNTTGFRVANLMLSKGEYIRDYTPKSASFTEVEMKFRPDSIIQNVNIGLGQGGKIAVAGTILDLNGFSQLNYGKLSVRLNNNGTHIYSYLQEGKVNGSIQALRTTITNDDVMAMTHERGAFLSIDYPDINTLGNYLTYISFDKYGILTPVAITFFQDVDFGGNALWLNKTGADVCSRIFGGKRSDGTGYTSIQGTNIQLVNPATGGFHANISRDDFDIYSNRTYVRGNLAVVGNKNCLQKTKFGDVPFYANEDVNSLLTETDVDTIYETKLVGDKYICRIEIDSIIQECINTTRPYNVYIDKMTWGDYKVEIREQDHFIVESDRPFRFKYKLEGRRSGFESESKINNFIRKMTVHLPYNKIPEKVQEKKEQFFLYKPR